MQPVRSDQEVRMRIADVMTRDLPTADSHASIRDAAREMRRTGIGRCPYATARNWSGSSPTGTWSRRWRETTIRRPSHWPIS